MTRRRSCWLALLVLVLMAALALWAAAELWERLDSHSGAKQEPREPASAAAGTGEGGFTVIRRGGPVRSRAPRAEDLRIAREVLRGGGREERCGPYRLLTDVPGQRLVTACGRLVAGLEEEYLRLYGVRPTGEPAEAIFLFRDRRGLRAFSDALAERSGRRRLGGYAGHAAGARGYLALHADSLDPNPTLRTLVHELTHLLNRRALGAELPRWLAEGLADGIGDRATENGLLPMTGVRGAEGEAKRLRLALAAGKVGGVGRLLDLGPGEFDRGTVSYDYEQSAMLVRFLLGDRDLAPRFRAALADLAAGEPWSSERFITRLGVTAEELDRRLRQWVLAS